jgi:cyclopropane-fatty-acyl-phospholipid synthase
MSATSIDVAGQAPSGAVDRMLRSRLLATLGSLRGGRIALTDAFGAITLGDAPAAACGRGSSPDGAHAGSKSVGAEAPPTGGIPTVRITVRDPAFYRAVAMRGSVGAGEAYIDGLWDCDDLVGLVRLLVRNRDRLDEMETGVARVGGWALRAWHALRPNTRGGSRRNIAAHYDLGNDFFALFLSPDLMYSSALWEGDDDTLEQASTRKLEAVCRHLQLQPGDRVVEIGTGWGGFALHAARHYGCHVTTTTISREQHALATRRVAEAGLQDRVTLLREDFRDLRGTYDKLASIEMVEAIGARNLEAYFAKIGSLLRPGGRALVQAITIEDHRYAQALGSVDFIKRHVFPGSFIPSVAALVAAKARASDLALDALSDFGPSYARTLQAWRQRFLAQLPQVRAQGFDERFVRLWEYYLAYCEGGFRERSIGVAHLALRKP